LSDFVLTLDHIQKSFGGVSALKGVSLDVKEGEFVTFLGPSGCGKTTTLRIIGGFEQPDSGKVILNGTDVTNFPPNKRMVNTVFQNYALFPHFTVEKNIGYGLKIQGVNKSEISARVKEALELVQLTEYGKRMPSQLSGGQRQRVAIARAVINHPHVLLLDEPLGALDLQLRRQMQNELKSLQKRLGITFIYITHDQEEALFLSDRIVVMNSGQFEQIDTPLKIYEQPKTRFAAQFIGMSNLIDTTLSKLGNDSNAELDYAGGKIKAQLAEHALQTGSPVSLSVRTERVDYGEESKFGFQLEGTIKERSYIGGTLRTILTLGEGQEIVATESGRDSQPEIGTKVFVFWNPAHAAVIED